MGADGGCAIGDLKGKIKISGREAAEVPAAHADLFCPICQTVSQHVFLNPEDPTRVRCMRCDATRDLNSWDPEESEINLAGYSPSDDDET
jgi:endogenous inhibitor of DNA gyrase (YacG/DUF329 family)